MAYFASNLRSDAFTVGLMLSRDCHLSNIIGTGPNINCKDADGMNSLMYAAVLKSAVDLVEILIKASANPYAMDSGSFTAVHHACVGSIQRLLDVCSKLD